MIDRVLSILVFCPALGAIVTLFIRSRHAVRWITLATTLATLLLSLGLWFGFQRSGGAVQFVEAASWIPSFNIQYKLGIDGLSLPLILLATFTFVLACIASWNNQALTRGYFGLLLILETTALGTLCAQDLLLFAVFFEVSLVPIFLLIGLWGGTHRAHAAGKFLLCMLIGSIALLGMVIGLYLHTRSIVPGGTFDLNVLCTPTMRQSLKDAGLTAGGARGLFLLAMLAFCIKLPAVPFHTWLADVHAEAPASLSLVISAAVLNLGGYSIFRIAIPLFPDAARDLWHVLAIVGVIGIVYGALCAMAQSDLKRMLALGTVSQMGYVLLGAALLTPAAAGGANFVLIGEGIAAALMFALVGVLHDRTHHTELSRLGGLAAPMPLFSGFGFLGCFAIMGLPGLCGFVGQLLVLVGGFAAARGDGGETLVARGYATPAQLYTLTIIACCGSVLTAGYMLQAIRNVFFGPVRPEYAELKDVDRREMLVLIPLSVIAIALGVVPGVLYFAFTNATQSEWLKLVLP